MYLNISGGQSGASHPPMPPHPTLGQAKPDPRLSPLTLLCFLLAIILLGMSFFALAFAEEVAETSAADRSDPIDTALGVADGGQGLTNVFGGTPEKPEVKDLYLTLYADLKTRPTSAALRNTAAQYQYTESQMWGILEGDFSTLRRTRPDLKNTEDILEEIERIQDTYDDEMEQQQLKSQLVVDTYPQEIFVNGDTSDSGFDVVYDLEILELLLFGDNQLSPTGGEEGLPGELPQPPSEDESGAGPSSGPTPASSGSGPSGGPSSSDDSDEGEDEDEEPSDEPDDEPGDDEPEDSDESTPNDDDDNFDADAAPDTPPHPAACTANTPIQDAFEDIFARADSEDDETSPEPAPDEPVADEDAPDFDGTRPPTPSRDRAPDDSGDSDTSNPSNFFNSDGSVRSAYTPAPAKEWADAPNVCNKVFCLKVRFTNRPDPQYEPTQNCVQCHVQNIVERLRATAATGLTPGKVSGNFMEPSMCKKSLFNSGVSLNFIPVAMPIKTPGASRLITGVDLGKEFEAFMKRTWGVEPERNFEQRLEQKIKYGSTIATPGRTNEDIFNEALAAYEDELEEISETLERSYLYSQFNGSTDFYQSMRYELDQMSVFFESYKVAITLAQEVVEERKNNLTPAE